MDKTPEEKKVEKEIGQMQNRQKILLNRKRTEEHRARTHRLIERGAILEAAFPPVVEMDNEEIKACWKLVKLHRRSWRRIFHIAVMSA